MGRNLTCNYKILIDMANGRQGSTGAENQQDAYQKGQSFAHAYSTQLVKIELWPQTSRARKQCKKDYIILDSEGKADHYSVNEPVPFYCF